MSGLTAIAALLWVTLSPQLPNGPLTVPYFVTDGEGIAGYGGDLAGYFLRYRNKLESRMDIPKYSGLSPGDIAVKRLH